MEQNQVYPPLNLHIQNFFSHIPFLKLTQIILHYHVQIGSFSLKLVSKGLPWEFSINSLYLFHQQRPVDSIS